MTTRFRGDCERLPAEPESQPEEPPAVEVGTWLRAGPGPFDVCVVTTAAAGHPLVGGPLDRTGHAGHPARRPDRSE